MKEPGPGAGPDADPAGGPGTDPPAPALDQATEPASLPEISPTQQRRAMDINVIAASLGSMWGSVIAPQVVMNVFFKNLLGASARELGVLVAATQFTGVFNILSIVIYAHLPRVKPFWISTWIAFRSFGFVPAVIAFLAWRGGAPAASTRILLVGTAVGWTLANLSVAGWYTWVTSYVPDEIRATFFGRRSAVVNTVTVVWFFAVTVVLDLFPGRELYLVYAIVFLVGAVAGVGDILLGIFIPEPHALRRRRVRAAAAAKPAARPSPAEPPFSWKDFVEPLTNRNFVGFCLSMALWAFSVNVLAPFLPPYITAPDGIGARNTWLGIMTVISTLATVATSTQWGMVADRFGRKPVVVLGSLYPLVWIAYFFLTRTNHIYLLPFVALLQGLLAPGINDGSGQLMLTLAPERSRTAYVAWYSAIAGMLPAAGAPIGGILDDALSEFSMQVGPVTVGSFQVVVVACFVLCVVSSIVLSRIREGREKPVAWVLARLVTPSVFRTFMNISVIGRPESSDRVARALRTTEAGSGAIAVKDIIGRLEDPEPEVREEAAKALGRIGSADAVDALLRHLGDGFSTIRPQAARALGKIGDARAIPRLIAGLADRSEEVQEACCQGLGRIGARPALGALVALLTEERSDRVAAAAGEAMSRLGAFEAALDLLPRMHATASRPLLRQFAIALGNLLGKPGGFYGWITAEPASRSVALERMLAEAWRVVTSIVGVGASGFETSTSRQATTTAMRDLAKAIDRQDYPCAAQMVYDVLLGLCRQLSGQDIQEDEALGFAFMHSAQLGLAMWFASEVRARMASIAGTELAEIDAALGIYALASYEEPDESE